MAWSSCHPTRSSSRPSTRSAENAVDPARFGAQALGVTRRIRTTTAALLLVFAMFAVAVAIVSDPIDLDDPIAWIADGDVVVGEHAMPRPAIATVSISEPKMALACPLGVVSIVAIAPKTSPPRV